MTNATIKTSIKPSIAAARNILEGMNNHELLGFDEQLPMVRNLVKCIEADQKVIKAVNIIEKCLDASGSDVSDLASFELEEMITNILDNVIDCEEVDLWLDTPSGEIRIISADHIDQLWTDSLIEQTKECYEGLADLPSFVAIDWEQTAENCKVDGMGHHFSGYDGKEHESEGFHLFRVN